MANDAERWFLILAPRPDVASIIIGNDLGGYRIYIHGVDETQHFEGGDTIQDNLDAVIGILRNYVSSETQWLDHDTREVVQPWDALCALSVFDPQ